MAYSWDLINTFHAVAKTGSLLAAARSLGVSQPTVGRHIDLLEAALKVTLFRRSRDGMALTDEGADLVATSGEMVNVADAFQRRASGLDKEISGTVRVSANDIFGVHVVPHLLRDFMEDNPSIEVELDISNTAANLSRRDADIALRMFRPVQNDLVARKVSDIPVGFYAHRTYIDRHGRPQTLADLRSHRLIGFDRATYQIDAGKSLGITLTTADFKFRCDTMSAQIEAVKAGIGIGILHQDYAGKLEGIEPLVTDVALPTMELWIACHAEVQYNRRVRLLVDFLAARLRKPYAF